MATVRPEARGPGGDDGATPSREGIRLALIGDTRTGEAGTILNQSMDVRECLHFELDAAAELPEDLNAIIIDADRDRPDRVSNWFRAAAEIGVDHWILLSSAEVNEPRHRHPGRASESSAARRRPINRVALAWRRIEEEATRSAKEHSPTVLTILRPATVAGDGSGPVGRLFGSRLAITIAGHDPTLQVLSPADLGWALRFCVEQRTEGLFNVAPAAAIPLRKALRAAGRRRLPLPHWVHRLGRRLKLAPTSLDEAQYRRYSWTVSGKALEEASGFTPRVSSHRALDSSIPATTASFDAFGQDKAYIRTFDRTLFPFLRDFWWRVESRGLEHVPGEGGAMLVGLHRGFMPLDGVMTRHVVDRERGRFVRFLIHPTLIKQPFLANFMTKLGGVVANGENAEWVLDRGGIVGVYPEGIRGAFSFYRDAHELKSFGRSDYVRIALRNRVPIIPFVTLGSAEIFPILGRIDWKWWQRHVEWPFFPITPTFPWLPIPLPSKWHMQFLAPIHLAQRYPPEAADDHATVREISLRIQDSLRETLHDMRRRRRHIFFGSLVETRGSK